MILPTLRSLTIYNRASSGSLFNAEKRLHRRHESDGSVKSDTTKEVSMLLVNAGFVGGFGAYRKARSLVQRLAELNVDYLLMTDSRQQSKLEAFGLHPSIVVPWQEENEWNYQWAEMYLNKRPYDCMISFGWRTFVPAHAVKTGKPVIIVDGGWPETLQPYPGEFCREVYEGLQAYCLTTHFSGCAEWLPPGIRFEWVSQPFSIGEVAWHQEVGNRDRASIIRDLVPVIPELHELRGKFVFLNMAPDYIWPWTLDRVGGWLTAEQLDECLGFVTRLLVELDQGGHTVFIPDVMASHFRPVLAQCHNLRVIERPFLDFTTHHLLRLAADVVICRAIRDVSSAQLALSGQTALHMICPARGGYMGEWTSVLEAERIGIARGVAHEEVPLMETIEAWLAGDESMTVAKKSAAVANEFFHRLGPDYLLSLLGY